MIPWNLIDTRLTSLISGRRCSNRSWCRRAWRSRRWAASTTWPSSSTETTSVRISSSSRSSRSWIGSSGGRISIWSWHLTASWLLPPDTVTPLVPSFLDWLVGWLVGLAGSPVDVVDWSWRCGSCCRFRPVHRERVGARGERHGRQHPQLLPQVPPVGQRTLRHRRRCHGQLHPQLR